MKKLLAICLMSLMGLSAFAQVDTLDKPVATPDTTYISFGKVKVLIVDDEDDGIGEDDSDGDDYISISISAEGDTTFVEKDSSKGELTHWGGIDLGMSFLMDADFNNSFSDEDEWLNQDYAHSFSWNFNFFEQKIRIADDYFGIVTGLGLQYRKFGFRDSMQLVSNSDSTFGTFLSEPGFTTNKFRTSSLTVPLLLEFNTSKKRSKSFHLGVGVVGAWNFRQTYKQHYELDGKQVRDKVRGDFNVNDFSVDATARIGYGSLTLFANYALTPFFKDGKGPELYPLNVGIQLVSW